MSKALVIKGASFAANKVKTIVINQPIPCTGISLSPTAITLTTIGATQQLTATLTPVDTTESLTFVSSNPEIATVSDTGLVTSLGVGSVTITAMCGTQSATCVCTLTESYVIDTKYHAQNFAAYSGSMDLNADPPKNHIGINTSSTRGRLYYSTENILGGYRVFVGGGQEGKYAIPLPKGATAVTVMPPEGLQSHQQFVLANSMEKQTYISGADGNAALGIKAWSEVPSIPTQYDISEYPEADSFILAVLTPSGGDPSAVSGTTTITFS